MWSSMMETVKKNPFGSPFITAECQQREDGQALVKGRNIAAANSAEGGELNNVRTKKKRKKKEHRSFKKF